METVKVLKVGDYVETCHLMPAILQRITITVISDKLEQKWNPDDEDVYKWEHYDVDEYDESNLPPNFLMADVEVFYPHMKEQSPEYTGGSCCSVNNCGVHRITKEYFDILINLGEEKLKVLWASTNKTTNIFPSWEKYVTTYVNNPQEIMKFIPIKKVIGKGIIEFKDNSRWKCHKQRIKSLSIRGGKRKTLNSFRYIPIERIKNEISG